MNESKLINSFVSFDLSDCRKLERDYPEVNSQKMIDNCVDLGVYCNKVCNTGGRWSMERLVWHLVSSTHIVSQQK